MKKLVFILHKRHDITREEMNEKWREQASEIAKYPGLVRWTHNYVVFPEGEDAVCDGYGEHYFETEDDMWALINSSVLHDARESARSYLDMDRTKMVIIDTQDIIDRTT